MLRKWLITVLNNLEKKPSNIASTLLYILLHFIVYALFTCSVILVEYFTRVSFSFVPDLYIFFIYLRSSNTYGGRLAAAVSKEKGMYTE